MITPVNGVLYWYDATVGDYGAFTAPGRESLPIDLSSSDFDNFVAYQTKPTAKNSTCRIPRGQLTVVNGDYIVTTANAVVSGLLVLGRIIIRAPYVKVRDCVVENQIAPTSTVNVIDTTNSAARFAEVEFCEVSSAVPTIYINGIGPKSVSVKRTHIHDVVDGMSISDSTGNNDPVSIETSLIEKLFYITPDPTHSDNRTHDDGIQSQGGPSTLTIRGNAIIGKDSALSTNGGSPSGFTISCVMLNTTSARLKTAVSVCDNWLDGGVDSINGRGTDGGVIEIKRNKFSRSRSGYPITTNITGSTQWTVPTSGADQNVYEDNGAPLNQTATFASGSNTIRRYT